MPRRDLVATIEPLGGDDLVALAQCHALDATIFPHVSLPKVLGLPSVFVAKDEGGVIGFAAISSADRNVVEIRGLAVDAMRRRLGIGRALLRAAVREAKARRAGHVLLHVSTANEAAVALYESERFEIVSRVRGYYRDAFKDGGDAYVMLKALRRRRSP